MVSLFENDGWFGRGFNLLGDIILISILWLVCSIPIITIGASSTAAYYVMMKSVRKKTGYITKEYFKCFRLNFKTALFFTFMMILSTILLVVDIVFLRAKSQNLYGVLLIIVYFILVGLIGFFTYLFPNLSRFTMGKLQLTKLSLYMEFRYLLSTLGSIATLFVAAFCVYVWTWTIFIVPGVVFYIFTFLVEPVLKKNMPVPTEGSEESEKWYYK